MYLNLYKHYDFILSYYSYPEADSAFLRIGRNITAWKCVVVSKYVYIYIHIHIYNSLYIYNVYIYIYV